MLTEKDLIKQINEAGLANSSLCLHSAYRSFGALEEGPQTVINAFQKSGCTLVCPAFYYESQAFPVKQNYQNNGVDYQAVNEMRTVSFTGSIDQIEACMGVIPKQLLKQEGTLRTYHPSNSFAVLGPDAQALIADQSELNVYSIYKNIYQNPRPAYIVLAGVDFTSCTPIHFAEEVAGRRLFRRWAVSNGQVTETEEGSCSNGFEKLREQIQNIESVITLGNGEARIYEFHVFIDAVAKIIVENPDVTHCEDDNCIRCNDMALGGRVVEETLLT
ncbi:AAC(3) family N-acetyltransferase [Vibrio sp. ZSDE26]|uniref:Aminoglycoside N(3)-acetyltransferase n=1 Tax=Vibrio amylolyticus TaxID=2847292 RepID=A0A9X1XMB3_9VIBR|nr:AAC(3) family N-acetyltransferase [Vibrio amylolyticus]